MLRVACLLLSLLVTPTSRACVWCAALGCQPCGVAASDEEIPGIARFRVQGGQQPQPGGDGTPLTVTYSFNNFLDGGLKDPNGVSVPEWYLRLVTQEAFGLWASVVPIHFVEVPDVGTPVYTNNNSAYNAFNTCESPNEAGCDFGTIRLSHRFINGSDAQVGMPAAKALAYFPSNGNNISGDIHFDNGDPWAVNGTPSEPDVLGILTHEIGHTLGLGHSTINGAVMFPAALRRMGPGTGLLTPDDIAGVRSIYGAGVGSVTPLIFVPEPAALTLLVLALLAKKSSRKNSD